MHDAVAEYQNALQAAIARAGPERGSYAAAIGALPNPLERTLPPDAASDPAGPSFTIGYAVTPTTLAAPACAPAGASPPPGPDTIGWLQCDAAVQESRMSLHVTVRVLDAAGVQTIAQRGDDVTPAPLRGPAVQRAGGPAGRRRRRFGARGRPGRRHGQRRVTRARSEPVAGGRDPHPRPLRMSRRRRQLRQRRAARSRRRAAGRGGLGQRQPARAIKMCAGSQRSRYTLPRQPADSIGAGCSWMKGT